MYKGDSGPLDLLSDCRGRKELEDVCTLLVQMDTADHFPTQRGPRENVVSAQVDTEGRIWSVQGLRLEADRASGVARSRPQDLPPPSGRRWTERKQMQYLKTGCLLVSCLQVAIEKLLKQADQTPVE